jgi:endonuclease/exonuclease/phosphatase family metal-dependent hydrolase
MMNGLRDSEADVIALQEVSRGWVINGSMDLYELARESLDMAGVAGASVATDWGNAVLSRAPIESAITRPLPPIDLPLPRAFTDTRITRQDGGAVRVLATHYHHVASDADVREEHSRFLARELSDPDAWILLGDFNARSGSPCLATLIGAGWIDVASAAGEAAAPALATYPARAPIRRIDTILHGPGLTLRDARVAPEWGSDHRAVVADLDLGSFQAGESQ